MTITGDLVVDYRALNDAAAAMKTAASAIDAAATAFMADSDVPDDAFTDKGEKAAEWYCEQREAMHLYLAASKQAYDDIGKAYSSAALVLQVVESRMARHAHGGGH